MTTIQMPQLGETIIEGTILKWLKQEGDSVARDEPLFEISTDKVDTEVPSPVAGTVTKILVEEGATVPGRHGRDGGRRRVGGAAPPPEPRRRRRRPPQEAAHAAPEEPRAADRRRPPRPPPAALAAAPAARRRRLPDRGPRSQIAVARSCGGSRRSTGSIWPSVAGTGPGGRITKKDVRGRDRRAGGAGGPRRTAAAAGRRSRRCRAPATRGRRGAGGRATPSSPCRTSARRSRSTCSRSIQTTARAWTMVEVNVDHLVRLRTASKDAFRAAPRREPHVPAVRRPRHGRRAAGVPARERADRRRLRSSRPRRSTWGSP